MDWQESAICRQVDPELFFPEKAQHEQARLAKKVCSTCPVKAECLQAGMFEEYGIWGGLSNVERRQIRKRMRLAA